MKLEDQMTSPELSKELKELGVPQDSLWYWQSINGSTPRLVHGNGEGVKYFCQCNLCGHDNDFCEKFNDSCGYGRTEITITNSAYTVAELGEMLPKDLRVGADTMGHLMIMKGYKVWHCVYDGDYRTTSRDEREAEARGKMLKWLIENKKVMVE